MKQPTPKPATKQNTYTLFDKNTEALQVFLILPRGQSKTKIWLLSRKGKDLNLEGVSYLNMHNQQDDPQVY